MAVHARYRRSVFRRAFILTAALALAGCGSLPLPQAESAASPGSGSAQLGAVIPVEGEAAAVTVAGRYIAASGEECIRYQEGGIPALACREPKGGGFVAAGPDLTRPSVVQAVAPAAGAPEQGVAMAPRPPVPVAAEPISVPDPEERAPVSQPVFLTPAPLLPDASAQSSGNEAQASVSYAMAEAPSVLPRRKPSFRPAAPHFVPASSPFPARLHTAPAEPRRRVLPPPGSVSWRDETVWEDAAMEVVIPGRDIPSGSGLSLREEFTRGASAHGTGPV